MLLNFSRLPFFGYVLLCGTCIFSCPDAHAQNKPTPPKTAFPVTDIFSHDASSTGFFRGRLVDITASEKTPAPTAEEIENQKKDQPVFVSSDPASHLTPPDENPKVRINPEAPGPFIGMATAYQQGDSETARKYADQFVTYQMNLMFEVRDLTQMIGEALVRKHVIDEEDWVGVGQFLDFEFASAREETGALLKPTHEEAMKRVIPDKNNGAEIYYFFTLDCSYCRKMASDVERLWQVAKGDKKLKMVALTMGPQEKDWIDQYRQYTGMTMPIFEGARIAKSFGVRFTPAIVVVSPSNNTAYLKTGQQDFGRLYEFVRTVQGLPATLTPEIEKLAKTPVGEAELAVKGGVNTGLWENGGGRGRIGNKVDVKGSGASTTSYSVERF